MEKGQNKPGFTLLGVCFETEFGDFFRNNHNSSSGEHFLQKSTQNSKLAVIQPHLLLGKNHLPLWEFAAC
jgi:hypothetical protein